MIYLNKLTKCFLLIIISFFLYTNFLYAWLVPWTINKWSYTSNITCNTTTSSYSPSWWSCISSWCDTYKSWSSCSICWTNPEILNWSWVVVTPSSCKSCVNSSFWCADYKYFASPVGTLNFTNYLNNNSNPTYASSSSNVKLTNDLFQSCNKFAKWSNHTPPSKSWIKTCEYSSISYWIWWSNWTCFIHWSTDNLISSFNQFWSVSRISPSDNNWTCTVEWRYAQADNVWPIITVNNIWNVFDWDSDHWCNMDKYLRADYWTSTNPFLSGCEYYKNLNPNIDTTDLRVLAIEEVTYETLNCDRSWIPANWYNEKWRCWENYWLDYWENELLTRSVIDVKQSFDEAYVIICNIHTGETNITLCHNKLLCTSWYKYDTNTKYCSPL